MDIRASYKHSVLPGNVRNVYSVSDSVNETLRNHSLSETLISIACITTARRTGSRGSSLVSAARKLDIDGVIGGNEHKRVYGVCAQESEEGTHQTSPEQW
jgi:predicted nucleotidyltransferase